MAPAFSSTRQAAAFALLLLALLLLPVLVDKSHLPPRSEIYSSVSPIMGSYEFLHQQLFVEKSDVDIAFIGSSRIYYGMDAPYVQKELSKKLGRPADVITLGWFWTGFDSIYFIAQDLLQHRKVKMLVFTEDCRNGDIPHRLAPRWFRFGDNADSLAGLPLRFQTAYYFAAIIGMPRNLLSLIRPNYPDLTLAGATTTERLWSAPNPMTNRGSLLAKLGYNYNEPEHLDFIDYQPTNHVLPEAVRIYSAGTRDEFRFAGPPASPLQIQFARKLAALAKAHNTKLVCLHLPEGDEARSPVISEREFWPEAMQADVAMVGIPPATLFAGLSDAEVRKLFMNSLHFNKNGSEFFNQLVTPALLQLYDLEVKP